VDAREPPRLPGGAGKIFKSGDFSARTRGKDAPTGGTKREMRRFLRGTALAVSDARHVPSRIERIRDHDQEEPFMETAKVDIKKLQLLSDRINQCIDALNQVRLSVHGLSPTPFAAGQQGLGAQPGFGTGIPGLSHTSGGIGAGFNPYLASGGFPGTGAGISGFGGAGMAAGFAGGPSGIPSLLGLSHTGPEAGDVYRSTWNDPYLAARVSQTFPYLQFAVPPVVSLY
jgi:hypothetical protein